MKTRNLNARITRKEAAVSIQKNQSVVDVQGEAGFDVKVHGGAMIVQNLQTS